MTGLSIGYAQTNVQLYRQIQREGYTGQQLALVRRAYELAMVLFTATYRPSGKPNIDHLVGTASILGRLRVPVELVAAGLLHPAYTYGDFGGLVSGVTRRKRAIVTRAIGPDAETHVARYAAMRSSGANLSALHAGFPALDRIGRHVAVIRLADVLEDHLDQGILYCFNAAGRRKSSQRMRAELVAMAEELGLPGLARELDRALAAIESADAPPELCGAMGRVRVFPVALPSYQRRLSVMLGRALVQGSGHVSSWLTRGLGHVGQWRRSRSGHPGLAGERPAKPDAPDGTGSTGTRGRPSASQGGKATDVVEPLDGGGHSR